MLALLVLKPPNLNSSEKYFIDHNIGNFVHFAFYVAIKNLHVTVLLRLFLDLRGGGGGRA